AFAGRHRLAVEAAGDAVVEAPGDLARREAGDVRPVVHRHAGVVAAAAAVGRAVDERAAGERGDEEETERTEQERAEDGGHGFPLYMHEVHFGSSQPSEKM